MMMENATGLVLYLEDCPENVLCTSMYMLFGGLNGINHPCAHKLLKFCSPAVTIIFSPKAVMGQEGGKWSQLMTQCLGEKVSGC